ncbi:alpha/beta hydrolase-fold protein [Dietzia sp. CH92]|uniref:alpha/beta hydrolase n=1 Tax=Dietzia sp. CH92 TaxID=3051823 RepID=UPI0028CFEDE3|nr:alpha/beta hydrolase-fold protein [Dietzia sp. CH92]
MGVDPHRGSTGGAASPLRRGARALTAAAAVSAMLAGTVAPATAQSAGTGSVDPGSLVPSFPPGSLVGTPSLSIAALTQLGAPVPLTSVLGSVGAIGSGDFPRPGSSQPPGGPVAVRDDAITETAVRRIEPLFRGSTDPVDSRAEVWTVASRSMQREVRVEVYRAPAGVDAPNVYFLDGVGSEIPSGWSTGMGWGDPVLRDRAVNVIAPTGGPASMWSDWQRDDPVLGPNKWETFLTEELPPLLRSGLDGVAGPLAHNGSWGVMGLSMGASAALHLANSYDMFDAVAGVSGAYSTLDELGYQYARLTVDARHGDVTNMWGPRGSADWVAHDTIADPSGLAGKSVYLSAATGLVGSSELGRFGSNELVLLDGHVLEKGSYESTRRLASALEDVPGVTLTTNYMPTGIHNWPVFVTQMLPGMDAVLAGLPAAEPNADPAAGGPADSAGGSTGSAGSSGSAGPAGSSGSARSVGAGSPAIAGSVGS